MLGMKLQRQKELDLEEVTQDISIRYVRQNQISVVKQQWKLVFSANPMIKRMTNVFFISEQKINSDAVFVNYENNSDSI